MSEIPASTFSSDDPSGESGAAAQIPSSSLARANDLFLANLLEIGFGDTEGECEAPRAEPHIWTAPGVEELQGRLPGYDVVRMLGRGGMGAVYEARHLRLNRRVAIKVLPAEMSEEPGMATRFRREAETMAQLRAPSVVQVHDCGETDAGHLYYVMEFVEGEDLAARLARSPAPTVEESLVILNTVCQSLTLLHTHGIVHRDVKPANVLLASSGQVKLADFGLAASVEREMLAPALTRPGSSLGTLEYAAPEQLARSARPGPATDIYSLGVITYEMLTGELPRGVFDPPSVRNPALEPAFDGVVLRALQSDPARRFASAEEFREALAQAADRRRQQSLREREMRRRLARRARAAAVLGSLALLALGAAMFAWSERGRAIASRVEARKAQADTEDLIQFLLTDLRKKLEPTGKLDAMESVLERAVAFFREKHRSSGNSDATALDLARVLVIKGDVIGVRGLSAEADKLYTEAIELAEKARDHSPLDVENTTSLAEYLRDRAEHRMTQGQFDQSLVDAERMQTELLKLPEPMRTAQTTEMIAASYVAIGNPKGYLGNLFGAGEAYREARRIYTELLAARPDDDGLRYALAVIETSLGSNAETLGNYDAMLTHFTAYHDYVLQRFGADSEIYSHAAFRMGVAMNKLERFGEAETFLSNAARIAEADLKKRPGHTGTMNHLHWCYLELAKASAGLKRDEAAEQWLTKSNEIEAARLKLERESAPDESAELVTDFARLHSEDDTGVEAWWDFCQKLQKAIEAGTQDPEEHRSRYQEWLMRITQESAGLPAAHPVRTAEAFIHNRIGSLLLNIDADAAAEEFAASLAIRQVLLEADPDNATLQIRACSSALHLTNARAYGSDDAQFFAATTVFLAAAKRLSQEALDQNRQGFSIAETFAATTEAAALHWPDAGNVARITEIRNDAATLLLRPNEQSALRK
ncbi:MAG: serine/threonine protein kinase [Verrucomicrobiae bacterium]|nr:serine/threonine protein kinase [Verrucomicrobiae bacterium]